MFFKTTRIEVRFEAAFEDAFKIVAARAPLMDLCVLLQIGARGKFLITDLTPEGFLTSMYPLMPD